MDECTLGQDKITCPIYVKDGLIMIDHGVKYVLNESRNNTTDAKLYTAIAEDGKNHPDMVDKDASGIIHFTIQRVNDRRTWMNI